MFNKLYRPKLTHNKGEMKYFKSILYDKCDVQYTKYQHEPIQGHKRNQPSIYLCLCLWRVTERDTHTGRDSEKHFNNDSSNN